VPPHRKRECRILQPLRAPERKKKSTTGKGAKDGEVVLRMRTRNPVQRSTQNAKERRTKSFYRRNGNKVKRDERGNSAVKVSESLGNTEVNERTETRGLTKRGL